VPLKGREEIVDGRYQASVNVTKNGGRGDNGRRDPSKMSN